ncbi:hypothetical protein [Fodinicola acaciae]|uniref:hypothetical protein n=1 Tax=Fodinicola acaciae TaxID=2681555 RepID=UPI0013D70B03|nr:hypothetical protein [Fodinicola acaciae]
MAGIEFSHDELDAKWADALTPAEVADRLAGVATPWYVAAGWSIELFTGRLRRHDDLEIAVPAAGFAELRERFAGCALDAPIDGRVFPDATEDELARTHQTWVRDPETGHYLVDIFREPHDADTWICRRDERIRRPYADIIRHTPDGVPYLAAEVALLFKAKATRPKDDDDFAAALPLLTAKQRETLAGWLDLVHPGHPWRAQL